MNRAWATSYLAQRVLPILSWSGAFGCLTAWLFDHKFSFDVSQLSHWTYALEIASGEIEGELRIGFAIGIAIAPSIWAVVTGYLFWRPPDWGRLLAGVVQISSAAFRRLTGPWFWLRSRTISKAKTRLWASQVVAGVDDAASASDREDLARPVDSLQRSRESHASAQSIGPKPPGDTIHDSALDQLEAQAKAAAARREAEPSDSTVPPATSVAQPVSDDQPTTDSTGRGSVEAPVSNVERTSSDDREAESGRLSPGPDAELARDIEQLNASDDVVVQDLRAIVNHYLQLQHWSLRPEFFVDTRGAHGDWEGDEFDSRTWAIIPLLAACPSRVCLVAFAALGGKAWKVPKLSLSKPGMPTWMAEDGESMACPVATLMAAQNRFIYTFGSTIDRGGWRSAVTPVLIMADGQVGGPDSVSEWAENGIDVAFLETTGSLADVFGPEPQEEMTSGQQQVFQRLVEFGMYLDVEYRKK